MNIQSGLQDFSDYSPNAALVSSDSCQAMIRDSKFRNDRNTMAFIGMGGTISSVYSVSDENIKPTAFFPVSDLLSDLSRSFGVAEDNVSCLSLFDKDSRKITVEDMVFVLDFLNGIENDRVVVLCGTYGLPTITQIIGKHLSSAKIVAVTGSMMISSMKEHDVDSNGIGAVSAVNALHTLGRVSSAPVVFAAFHGKIYRPEECIDLDLHPQSHADVEFYRGQPIKRKK